MSAQPETTVGQTERDAESGMSESWLTDSVLREWADLSRDGRARFRACETTPNGRQFCVFIAGGAIGKATGRFRFVATLMAVVRCARVS